MLDEAVLDEAVLDEAVLDEAALDGAVLDETGAPRARHAARRSGSIEAW